MSESDRPLWPHQARALADLRDRMRGGRRRVMVQLPTGGGKTRLAAEIIRSALDKDKTAAFLVPRLSLVDQTVSAFWNEGVRAVGVMQGQHPLTDGDQPVQVVSVQTLDRVPCRVVDMDDTEARKVASYADDDQVEAVAEIVAERKAKVKPTHDLVSPPELPPRGEPARPLRNLENISGGELARWIKLTTPNDRSHVIRVLRMAADILQDEMVTA